MSEKFTVTFYDDDKKTVLDKQEVEKGASVKYNGNIPTKASENGIEYVFVGWETIGNMNMVIENIQLFAKYEAGTKTSSKEEKSMFELSEANAANAKLNEIMEAGNKINEIERATRNLTVEQKKDLVNEIKDKGSVNLDKQTEIERD